ncbi:hypothetical protein [Hankyongella ginsenosidimutans]
MTLRDYIPPVHPEGRNFIIIALVIAAVGFLAGLSGLGWFFCC